MDTKVKVRWVSAALWVFSWRIVYLEIFRWQHMTRTLRFRAPGFDGEPRPGLPVRAIRACAVLSPVVFLATLVRRPAG
jgi:hypothetical protein